MFKAIALIGVGSALALLPAAASAQQGHFVILRHRRLGPGGPDNIAHEQAARLESRQPGQVPV